MTLILVSNVWAQRQPSAPTNLTATAASSSRIDLRWTDTNSAEDSYRIEYSTSSIFSRVETISVPPNTIAWSVTGLSVATTYYFRVFAVAGKKTSAPSNTASAQTFVPCSYTISPTSQSFGSAGGTGSINVTAQTGCNWRATSGDIWITVNTTSGNGNGSVTYSVSPNTAATSRTGNITIEGQTFIVTQSGVSCSYGITPTNQSFTSNGGSGNVNVTAPAGCNWAAASHVSWITVTAGGSGSGNGTVNYSVASNTTTATRTGTMTIAERMFTVTQAGSSACAYSISPTSASFTANANSGSVFVSTTTGCSWTATSNVSWIVITSGASGSTSGWVNYSVGANSGGARTGTMTIAGQIFTVTQAGQTCIYSISPSSASFAATGGSGTLAVNTTAGCSWTASSNVSWVTISSGSAGSGGGTVSFNVAANSSVNARTGTISVAGQTFTITQAGASCSYSISPTSQSFGDAGGNGSVSVTAQTGCAWTAGSNVSWLTITNGATGNGNGVVSYSVATNSGTATRTGSLTIAGQTFSVTQSSDITAPSVVMATPINGGVVKGTFNVSASASDNRGVTKVEFYRDNNVFIGAATVPVYAVSFNSTTINDGTHTFYAKAYDAANNAGTSASVSVMVDNNPPTVPSGLTATPISYNEISLYWNPSTDSGAGVSHYRVFRNGVFIAQVTAPTASFVDVGLEENTSYAYRVSAVDKAANESAQSTSVSTTTPSRPVPVIADAGADQTVNVGQSVILDGSNSIVNSGGTPTFVWNLGDGTTKTGRVVTHTYDVAGAYTVTLTVTDGLGNSGADTTLVVVRDASAGRTLWVRSFGGVNFDYAYGVTTDPADKSVIVVGSVDAGVGVIYKYSADGVLLWSKRYSGNSTVRAAAIAPNRDIVVTGGYFGTVEFGGATMRGAGGYNIFVARYNAAGTLLWVKSFGGGSDADNLDSGMSIAVDSNDNIIVGGHFNTQVNFGGGTLSNGSIFVVKLTGGGGHVWSKGFNSGYDRNSNYTCGSGLGVAVDAAGSVVLVGSFIGTADFGGGPVTSQAVDAFVVKFTSAGTYVWGKRLGSGRLDYANAVAVDSAGNVVVTGGYGETVDFGGASLTSAHIYANNAFTVKYNAAGVLQWARSFGSADKLRHQSGRGVAIDTAGNVIVGGVFLSETTFAGVPLVSNGVDDIFVVKYSAAGREIWGKNFGGAGGDAVWGVARDADNRILVVGSYNLTANFGDVTLTSAGVSDGYALKLTP